MKPLLDLQPSVITYALARIASLHRNRCAYLAARLLRVGHGPTLNEPLLLLLPLQRRGASLNEAVNSPVLLSHHRKAIFSDV